MALALAAASTRRPSSAGNTAPTASLAYTTAPNLLTGRVLGRVRARDADRDRLTYVATEPLKGTVSINTNGIFAYTPSPNARHAAASTNATEADRTDTFAVAVTDGQGGSVSVPVTVLIRPINSKPQARNHSDAPDADSGTVTGTITVVDRDGDPITFTAPNVTDKGAVTIDTDGSYTYVPTAAARSAARNPLRRNDIFTITVNDGHGGTDTVTIPVTILPALTNAAPTNGSASATNPDNDGRVAGTVIATDPDRDPLTYELGATTPLRGSVIVDGDGTFTYTPTADARHTASATNAPTAVTQDYFTVAVSDGRGGSLVVPVTVTISPKNSAPSADYSVGQPDPVTGAVTGQITSTDPDGDTRTYSGAIRSVKGGGVQINADGTFIYTPTTEMRTAAADPGATEEDRTDSLLAVVDDGHLGGVTPLTLAVRILGSTPGENRPPQQASDPTYDLPNSQTGAVVGKFNVIDPDGDRLFYTVAPIGDSSLDDGTFEIDNTTGTWTFFPRSERMHEAAASVGRPDTYSFRWTANDGRGGILEGTITLPVAGRNTDPVVAPSPTYHRDTATGDIIGTVGAGDYDGDYVAVVATTDSDLGTVTVDWIGGNLFQWRYASAPGSDAEAWRDILFTATDDHGGIALSRNNVSFQPAAVTRSAEEALATGRTNTKPDDLATGAISGVVSVGTHPAGSVTYHASSPARGSVVIDPATGAYTYTPSLQARYDAAADSESNPRGNVDTFTVTVRGTDGLVQETIGIVVPISDLNRPAVASVTITEQNSYTGLTKGRVTATDPDGHDDGFAFTVSSKSTTRVRDLVYSTTPLGRVTINYFDGTFEYTPTVAARVLSAERNGIRDVFYVTVEDGYGHRVYQPVSISIAPVIYAPPPTDPTRPPAGPTRVATLRDLFESPGFMKEVDSVGSARCRSGGCGVTDGDWILDGYTSTLIDETVHPSRTFGGRIGQASYDVEVHTKYRRYVETEAITTTQPPEGTEEYLITWVKGIDDYAGDRRITSVTALSSGSTYTAQSVLQLRDLEHLIVCTNGCAGGTASFTDGEALPVAGPVWDTDIVDLGLVAGAMVVRFSAGTFPMGLFPLTSPPGQFDPIFEEPLQHMQEEGWDLQRSQCVGHGSLEAAQFVVFYRPTGKGGGFAGFASKIPGKINSTTREQFAAANDDLDALWSSCDSIPSNGDNDN
ncbi:Ig-like domain-containing protein [Mycolicibacterium sp. 018/SC-01/001]|uniref:Ig-like domain-containing protein n=1 Tax=Mycolicibacterium sp. 018/SC-01/001 TaxID=2592069 RepID=UPI00163D7D4E|nr:Ig-like domain-containing protein [Mycolicibacterium sp. 018/SC-01/001]